LLRDHGRGEKYEHERVGFNGRLDTIQAAILRIKLHKLEQWNNARRKIAGFYRSRLKDMPVTMPPADDDAESVMHLFVIRSPARQVLQQFLESSGVSTGVHYPIPLHLQPAYKHLGYRAGAFTESERAAREVLSLPIYPELSQEN